jgi:hypothetical protein
MKLLFLGLFILIIMMNLIIKYLNIKHKENFNILEGLDSMGQSDMLKSQDQYYDVRSKGSGSGILIPKKGMSNWLYMDDANKLKNKNSGLSLDESSVDKKITQCAKLTSCGDLENSDCGYCNSTRSFAYGDANGPSDTVCPDGPGGIKQWSKSSEECNKIKEKTICKNVKDCGDLYGDAEKLCGYCPTSGESVAMKKVGNKYVPKYSDDTCNSKSGLILGSKCAAFAKEHPCITPYHESGKHNVDCLKKLWKNSGCKREKPYGSTFEYLSNILLKPYKIIGEEMKKTYENTFSNKYDVAKSESILCYNNSNNLKPCDEKYKSIKFGTEMVPKDCYKKKFIEAGCTKEGKGWNDIQNYYNLSNILKKVRKNEIYKNVSNDNYLDTIKNIENIATNGSSGTPDLYNLKKLAAQECYGKIPPPPPPIKIGDNVTIKKGDYTLDGIVMEDKVDKIGVLWLKILQNNTIKIDRKNLDMEKQKKYFGWPSIPATSSLYKVGDELGYVRKRNVFVKKRCDSLKSECKLSCNDLINENRIKYPKPRDCIVGQYGKWGPCSKSCGGGIQKKTRPILYEAKYWGNPCPKLSLTRMCNMQSCVDPNFREKPKYPGGSIRLKRYHYGCPAQTFYKNGSYWKGSNRNLIPRGNELFCCTNTWCSARRGGWFYRFNKNHNQLEYK